MMDIIEISKIHNRAPGGIISRLIKHNYIANRVLARGYSVYKNSDLYKEIVANNKKNTVDKPVKASKPQSSIDNISINVNTTTDNSEIKNDIQEIKKEMLSLKKMVQELSELLHSVYEFV